MKKLLLSAYAICAMVSLITAQQTVFEGAENMSNVQFVKYGYVSSIDGREGHYEPKNLREDTLTFTVKYLKSGTPYQLNTVSQAGKEQKLIDLATWDNVDHFTHPALFFRMAGSTMGTYVFIDDMFIELKYPKEDGSYDEIGGMYLPVVKEVVAEGEAPKKKKKITMKERMAAVKAAAKSAYGVGGSAPISGNASYMKYVNTNIDSLVTTHMTKMKTKQASADPKKEAALQLEVETARKNWDQEVADSWDTPEGRRVMANMSGHSDKNSYKLRNDTGREIDIMVGGVVSHLSANRGHSSNIACTDHAYYAIEKNGSMVQGNLITRGNVSCGNTFSVK